MQEFHYAYRHELNLTKSLSVNISNLHITKLRYRRVSASTRDATALWLACSSAGERLLNDATAQ